MYIYLSIIVLILFCFLSNTDVVFSNHIPSTKELSKGRWKIFRIVMAGLKDITLRVWKNQHDDKTCQQNNVKKDNDDDDNVDDDIS